MEGKDEMSWQLLKESEEEISYKKIQIQQNDQLFTDLTPKKKCRKQTVGEITKGRYKKRSM